MCTVCLERGRDGITWPVQVLFMNEGRGELRARRILETEVHGHGTARRAAFLRAMPGLVILR